MRFVRLRLADDNVHFNQLEIVMVNMEKVQQIKREGPTRMRLIFDIPDSRDLIIEVGSETDAGDFMNSVRELP